MRIISRIRFKRLTSDCNIDRPLVRSDTRLRIPSLTCLAPNRPFCPANLLAFPPATPRHRSRYARATHITADEAAEDPSLPYWPHHGSLPPDKKNKLQKEVLLKPTRSWASRTFSIHLLLARKLVLEHTVAGIWHSSGRMSLGNDARLQGVARPTNQAHQGSQAHDLLRNNHAKSHSDCYLLHLGEFVYAFKIVRTVVPSGKAGTHACERLQSAVFGNPSFSRSRV